MEGIDLFRSDSTAQRLRQQANRRVIVGGSRGRLRLQLTKEPVGRLEVERDPTDDHFDPVWRRALGEPLPDLVGQRPHRQTLAGRLVGMAQEGIDFFGLAALTDPHTHKRLALGRRHSLRRRRRRQSRADQEQYGRQASGESAPTVRLGG